MDIQSVQSNFGVIAALFVIAGLIFAESGFLFGLFVPGGDLLLLAAGVFAAEGDLPLPWLLLTVFIAALASYEVGYFIGAKTGPRIFKRKAGMFFRKEYVEYATDFYSAHGGKTILIARFVAYVRTVVPLLAGMAGMGRRKFIIYNLAGAFLWTVLVIMVGYWFGSAFADEIKRFMLPITLGGIVIVCAATVWSMLSIRSRRR